MKTITSISENVKRLLLDKDFLISVLGEPFDQSATLNETNTSDFVSTFSAAEIQEARYILQHLDSSASLSAQPDILEVRNYIASYLRGQKHCFL